MQQLTSHDNESSKLWHVRIKIYMHNIGGSSGVPKALMRLDRQQ